MRCSPPWPQPDSDACAGSTNDTAGSPRLSSDRSNLTAMRKRKVAVLGASGTVGQRFISLLAGHPWFEISALTTSDAKAGKRYGDVTQWHFGADMPAEIADLKLEATRGEIDAEICFSELPNGEAA